MAGLRVYVRLLRLLLYTAAWFVLQSISGLRAGKHKRRAVYRQTAARWSRGVMRIFNVRLYVTGAPPLGYCFVVANHRSFLDIPALMSIMPCAFLSKAEVRGWPLIGKAAQRIETVFVDRESPQSRAASLEAMAERVNKGLLVAVFPEGAIGPYGDILDFRAGMFNLAAHMNVPVTPVALEYDNPAWTWEEPTFWPYFRRIAQLRGPTTLKIRIGNTLEPGNPIELRLQVENWIRAELRQMTQSVNI